MRTWKQALKTWGGGPDHAPTPKLHAGPAARGGGIRISTKNRLGDPTCYEDSLPSNPVRRYLKFAMSRLEAKAATRVPNI